MPIFSVVWNGRLYVLAVDYNRYLIGKLCSVNVDEGKNIYWSN